MASTYVYVSSWGKNPGEGGLSAYSFNEESGALEFIERTESGVGFNVTYFDDKRGILYALEEANNLPGLRGGGGGRIFTYKVDPTTGKLVRLGIMPTWCANPSYLTQDMSKRFLVVSHHGSSSAVTKLGTDAAGNLFPVVERDDVAVELFSLDEAGVPDRLVDAVKHTGSGPERRQAIAHPHTAVMSPSGSLYAVCDKGNDTVRMYKLDSEQNKLVQPSHIYYHEPGTLPRYCAFHPSKPWFYHNAEHAMKLYAFTYEEDGRLELMDSCDAVPTSVLEGRSPRMEQQGFVMDQSGRFVYSVVRDPASVAVFEIDQDNGCPQLIQSCEVHGEWPRGCAISPDGRFLIVCCKDSEEIVVFPIQRDGKLQENGCSYSNPTAAYAIFCKFG